MSICTVIIQDAGNIGVMNRLDQIVFFGASERPNYYKTFDFQWFIMSSSKRVRELWFVGFHLR